MTKEIKQIKLLQKSKLLIVAFTNDETFELPCSYCRIFSPAADQNLQDSDVDAIIERDVNITAITPVGNYAVKLTFDDGHDTGIYSWDYLYQLGKQYLGEELAS